jgi:hypothetical protein
MNTVATLFPLGGVRFNVFDGLGLKSVNASTSPSNSSSMPTNIELP